MENEPKELILVDLAVMFNDGVLEPKPFYEPVKPKPVIVAEKHCSYMANDEKYSLDGYSEHQRENWAYSNRIIIYENEAQIAFNASGYKDIPLEYRPTGDREESGNIFADLVK
jgi:hypothetical protein